MLNRLFNSESKSITGAALLLSTTTLISRIIGLLRDRIFAHYFGAGSVMDAYYAAFRVPDLIYNLLIAGALTAGFIPVFIKLFYESEDKSVAWKLVNNVLNIVGVTLAFITFFGIIFTPLLVKMVAPGFTEENLDLVVRFTRIMLLSPLFLGISMVLGGVLQSLRQFLLYSFAPIFYNLGIIFGAAVLTKIFGVTGLAYGVVLGAGLHLLLQIFGVHKNHFRWKWEFNLKDSSTRLIGNLMLPRAFGLAVTQINILIITAMASLLPIGSVSVFNYANNLQAVPAGIIGIPFALAVFPVLSRKALHMENGEFGEQISNTARQIIFLIAPLSVCILLLRAQIVRVVLGSGVFDWNATVSTADALAFFSLGLFAQSLIPLFARSFYALNNTKTPFLIGIVSEVISIISAVLLMKPLGVPGLALAISIGAFVNLILLVVWLEKKTKVVINYSFFIMLLKISGASLIMGVVVQISKYPLAELFDQRYFMGILSQGLVAGILGFLAYGLLCKLLKVEEMTLLQASLRKRWFKVRSVGEGVDEAEKL